MVPTFVRVVRVIIIKLGLLVLDVDLLVVLELDKRLRVRHRLIEYVHKTYVLVPLVQLLLVQPVQQMVLPFVQVSCYNLHLKKNNARSYTNLTSLCLIFLYFLLSLSCFISFSSFFLSSFQVVVLIITKMVKLALGVDLLVKLEHEKQLLVLLHPIVNVHKIFVRVRMVSLLLELVVLQTMLINAILVAPDITKLVTLVPLADLLAAREQDKQQLVLRHLIVDVLKMYVPVPTV